MEMEALKTLGLRQYCLPLGSLVVLKDDDLLLMVIGRQLGYKNEEGTLDSFDYCGCVYPEGMINGQGLFFNKEDIAVVEYIGYINDKEKAFRKNMESLRGN